jgi:hypothetical protein
MVFFFHFVALVLDAEFLVFAVLRFEAIWVFGRDEDKGCVVTRQAVAGAPRNSATSSRNGYHSIKARNATGECARVRFMLVMRPCWWICRSNSGRLPAGASS